MTTRETPTERRERRIRELEQQLDTRSNGNGSGNGVGAGVVAGLAMVLVFLMVAAGSCGYLVLDERGERDATVVQAEVGALERRLDEEIANRRAADEMLDADMRRDFSLVLGRVEDRLDGRIDEVAEALAEALSNPETDAEMFVRLFTAQIAAMEEAGLLITQDFVLELIKACACGPECPQPKPTTTPTTKPPATTTTT
ncbi:MAG: hypothetical protein WD883_03130, partial [Candidatus Colwellbacteria bacterium]